MPAKHRPIPELTDDEKMRFFAKIAVSDSCHIWTGCKCRHGRGRMALRRHPALAPRIAYRIATGCDPREMVVMHRCDNPSCVNPNHLVAGTQMDNLADCKAKGRTVRGERNGQNKLAGKLSEAKVRVIKSRLKAGARTGDLAREYGVGPAQISNIKTGTKWGWV